MSITVLIYLSLCLKHLKLQGRTLGDDSWTGITLSEGMLCMMMGSADEIPQAPAYSDSLEGKLAIL